MKEQVCVVGLGYIGLPLAALLAEKQIAVCGYDIQEKVVEKINKGEIHFIEPNLEGLVRQGVQGGFLKAQTTPSAAEVYVIAVPTPILEDKTPNLSYLESAARSVAPYLQKGNLVILESTSPVGTTQAFTQWLAEERPDLNLELDNDMDILLAYCPERVMPGRILTELRGNDRIVGGLTEEATQAAIAFYQQFVKGEVVGTNARTAELTKLAENAYRDVNIAFANELSSICERHSINVWELIEHANRHPRVNILKPGPGVGGHCIAVDPWFIYVSAPEEARLIQTARCVNDNKPLRVIEQVLEAAKKITQPKIACFGLTFKADVDDLRESPALFICEQIIKARVGEVMIVEPMIDLLPSQLCHAKKASFEEAIEWADILVLLVDHRDFKPLTQEALEKKVVIDTRGVWVHPLLSHQVFERYSRV